MGSLATAIFTFLLMRHTTLVSTPLLLLLLFLFWLLVAQASGLNLASRLLLIAPLSVWVAAPLVTAALLRAPRADLARFAHDPRLHGDIVRSRLAVAKSATLAVGLLAAAAAGVLPFPHARREVAGLVGWSLFSPNGAPKVALPGETGGVA